MAYKTMIGNTDYKFERSGFFGTGTDIKIYRNGVLYKECSFSDINGENSLINEGKYFENICEMWAGFEETRITITSKLNG